MWFVCQVLYRGSVDLGSVVCLPSCFGIHRNYDPNVRNGCKMLLLFDITHSGLNNKDNQLDYLSGHILIISVLLLGLCLIIFKFPYHHH